MIRFLAQNGFRYLEDKWANKTKKKGLVVNLTLTT